MVRQIDDMKLGLRADELTVENSPQKQRGGHAPSLQMISNESYRSAA
jgi:hypothetical protein